MVQGTVERRQPTEVDLALQGDIGTLGKVYFLKNSDNPAFQGKKNNLQNRTVTPACLQSADSSSFMALAYDFPWSFKILTRISCLDTNDLTQELPLWKRELHSVYFPVLVNVWIGKRVIL